MLDFYNFFLESCTYAFYIFTPIVLPSIISFLLNKIKFKASKYLSPLVSMIILIIYYFKYVNFKYDPDAFMSGFENLGNFIFMVFIGLGFIFSLFLCIILDRPRVTNKSNDKEKQVGQIQISNHITTNNLIILSFFLLVAQLILEYTFKQSLFNYNTIVLGIVLLLYIIGYIFLKFGKYISKFLFFIAGLLSLSIFFYIFNLLAGIILVYCSSKIKKFTNIRLCL